MAFSFGGGVRPELGKTDYSGYLQGALQGARGVGAGGAAMGQGIANLGASAGDAMQKYGEKKKKDKLFDASNRVEIKTLENLGNSKYATPEQKEDVVGILERLEGMSPEEQHVTLATANKSISNAVALVMSQKELDANIKRMGNTKKPSSPAKQANYIFARETLNMTHAQALEFVGGGPSVNVNTGAGDRRKQFAFEQLYKTRNQDMSQLLNSRINIDSMDALINATDEGGKVITGALANLELGAKSLLNKAGLSNFQDVAATQEYLGNSVMQVGQIIKLFGAGTGLSDADREFAKDAAGGSITMDRKALQRLVSMAKEVMTAKGEEFNQKVNLAFGNDGDENDQWSRKSLMLDPSAFLFGGSSPEKVESSGGANFSTPRGFIKNPDGTYSRQ
tara:strand:- start:3372 stop:4550 length:1179 start_codon:yes stop_codon:yes gene_type:complete